MWFSTRSQNRGPLVTFQRSSRSACPSSVTFYSPFLPIVCWPGSTTNTCAFSGPLPRWIFEVKVYIFNLFLPWNLSYAANDCPWLGKLGGSHNQIYEFCPRENRSQTHWPHSAPSYRQLLPHLHMTFSSLYMDRMNFTRPDYRAQEMDF